MESEIIQQNKKTEDVITTINVCTTKKFLNVKQLCEFLNISRSTFYRQRDSGLIPEPDIIIGLNSPRWNLEKLIEHIKVKGKEQYAR